jgi:hypothetical protein
MFIMCIQINIQLGNNLSNCFKNDENSTENMINGTFSRKNVCYYYFNSIGLI